jgi:hypothetical protein
MSAVESIGIAVGPAAVVGATSYLVARLQLGAAYADRLHEHRSRRLEAYHALVDSVDVYSRYLKGEEGFQPGRIVALSDQCGSRIERVYLLGVEDVIEAANEFSELIDEIEGQAEKLSGPVEQKAAVLNREYQQRVSEVRMRLVKAMRRDVGPESVL